MSQEGNGLLRKDLAKRKEKKRKSLATGRGRASFKRMGSLVLKKTARAWPELGHPGGMAMGAGLFGRGEAEGPVFLARPPPNAPATLAKTHARSHEDPLSGKRGQGAAVSEGAARAPGKRGVA